MESELADCRPRTLRTWPVKESGREWSSDEIEWMSTCQLMMRGLTAMNMCDWCDLLHLASLTQLQGLQDQSFRHRSPRESLPLHECPESDRLLVYNLMQLKRVLDVLTEIPLIKYISRAAQYACKCCSDSSKCLAVECSRCSMASLSEEFQGFRVRHFVNCVRGKILNVLERYRG